MNAQNLPFKRGVQVTGPDMILIFWIARIALEDRDAYDHVKHELKLKGDEAARLYSAVCNFLGSDDES